MKSLLLIVFLSVSLLLVSFRPAPNRMYFVRTVVIDAGHGGHDSGCLGSSAKEKHIALDIALRLGKLIQDNLPDVRVVYTRKSDTFIELHERAGIANRAKADLFICIHANSGAPAAFGTETYVMGLHKTEENLTVARRENSSVLLENDYQTKYDGFDPKSPEAHIIFSLFQNAFINQSLSFASKIQAELEEYAGRYNRGVKQAGFLVLYRTSMPSVLIETGFLTNKTEEKYLLSDKGQGDMAQSIFRAFKAYKMDMESENGSIEPKIEPRPEVNEVTLNTPPKKDTVKTNTAGNQANREDSVGIEPKNAVDPLKPAKKDSTTKAGDSSAATEKPVPPVEEPVKPVTEKEKPAPAVEKPVSQELFYTVQIGAVQTSATQSIEKFKISGVTPIKGDDGFTRFTAGNFTTLDEAMKKQTEMRNKGFKDAFVTAYYRGRRISLKEAGALPK